MVRRILGEIEAIIQSILIISGLIMMILECEDELMQVKVLVGAVLCLFLGALPSIIEYFFGKEDDEWLNG